VDSGRCDRLDVSEAEYVAQEFLGKSDGRLLGRMCARKKLAEKRLANAEVARCLVAKGEPLGDVVVGVRLVRHLALSDGGKLGRRDEGAFEADGVEREIRFADASHAKRLPG
jgi:hypothetical protein